MVTMSLAGSKINIVFLTDCLADLTGGAERQIFELAKRLDKEKYSVTIASLECEGAAPRQLIESIGCRLVTFPVKRIYSPAGIVQGFRFASFLKKNKIHILQTYHFGSDIWGTIFGRLVKVKLIISNRRDMGFWRSRQHVLAYKLVNRWVDRIVVVACAVGNLVRKEENINEEKIRTIYNGVEFQNASTSSVTRESIGVKADDVVIMHVANLRPVKGHSFLLRALAQIVLKSSNVKLVLIGDDTLKGALQQLAGELKVLDNVIFLGKRKDARDLLKLADICVLPSLSEGMSNAILEYMAAGKPVVATSVGGNPELVQDGQNGILVDKENVEQLRDALASLVANPSQRAAMGGQGRKRIEQEFTMARMVQKYEGIYAQITPLGKKILHLISSLGLYGAENVLLLLAQSFQRHGVFSYVGAVADPRHPQPLILEKARELDIPQVNLPGRGRFDLRMILGLCAYIKENHIDILHTHNYKSDLIGLLAAWMTGIPIVATAHGFTDLSAAVSRYEQMDRFILRKFFKRVVVVSDKVLPHCPAEKKRVIPNGLDIAQFAVGRDPARALRQKFNIGPQDVVIGTVGRLSKEKNQDMLIRAFHQTCSASWLSLKLVIVGDGPEREKLQALVAQLNLTGKVIFTGVIKEMPVVYQMLDIFVLSSLTEGVPLTVLEAMAAKVPVVATRVGGIPEIVTDGETGLLVDSKDAADLSAKINMLVSDQTRRDKLAANAFAVVQSHYSLEKMRLAYSHVYQEVLSG